MTSKAKFKSDAFEAIYSAAQGLHRAGTIGMASMLDFDESCLASPVEIAPVDGKTGHRAYLWVYHSPSVVHYVLQLLDASRSARVVEDELGEVACGIISCDRYSAYMKFARPHPRLPALVNDSI